MGLLFYIPDHDLFYQHITKCAGRSIEEWLGENVNVHDIGQDGGPDGTHRHLVNRNFDRSFTSIRNPFDRLVSSFKSLVKVKQHALHIGKFNPTFADYVKYLCGIQDIEPVYTDMFHGKYADDLMKHYKLEDRIHTCPMTHPFYKADKFETLIRFENLLQDWDDVLTKYGLPSENPLPHFNESRGLDYWRYYDKEARGIVSELYKEDLLTFGYKF